jgi:hypothetical protein
MNLRLTLRASPNRTDLHSVTSLRVTARDSPAGTIGHLTFSDRDGGERTVELSTIRLLDVDDQAGGD